jgi:hypothetical protein
VEVKTMKRRRVVGLSLALLVFALLVASAQAGATKPQLGKVKQTARPIPVLAMDGPRVAYMMNDRRVGVWNVVTGGTSMIKGKYPTKGASFGYGSGEVAIAGKRVALITRFVIGNTLQTQERLYTAPVGGSARQLGKLTNHSSYYGDCTVPGSSGSDGDWIGGLVGSGKALSVSTWKSNDSATTGERLRLITPTGLRTIATGPGAIVSQSADRGHIAVLRSTDAWPAYQGPLEQSTPTVGVYSTSRRLLHEVALNIPPPNQACGSPSTNILGIALSGNQLAVLRRDARQRSLTVTVEVYDWTTGALVHTWVPQPRPKACNLAASGRLSVYSAGCGYIGGTQRLHLLDLATGNDVVIAHAPGNGGYIAAMDSHGLVYSADPYTPKKARGKLVFVPTAKLRAALSK